MAQIICRDLTLGYDNEVVLKGLNFQVDAGDYLCIVGENGSGKSTLMKTILGLTPPLGGEIRWGDGLNAHTIGYLPQQTVVQRDFPASVQEIVLSGCQNRPGFRVFYKPEDRQKAERNMERMGIADLAKRCYRDLSGGQQQRVLLARALCASDKMLVLDEPVSGLDPKMAEVMYRLVERINREIGITVIMISHDVQEAIPYATHILHMGREYFFGTVEEYRRSRFGNAFLQPE